MISNERKVTMKSIKLNPKIIGTKFDENVNLLYEVEFENVFLNYNHAVSLCGKEAMVKYTEGVKRNNHSSPTKTSDVPSTPTKPYYNNNAKKSPNNGHRKSTTPCTSPIAKDFPTLNPELFNVLKIPPLFPPLETITSLDTDVVRENALIRLSSQKQPAETASRKTGESPTAKRDITSSRLEIKELELPQRITQKSSPTKIQSLLSKSTPPGKLQSTSISPNHRTSKPLIVIKGNINKLISPRSAILGSESLEHSEHAVLRTNQQDIVKIATTTISKPFSECSTTLSEVTSAKLLSPPKVFIPPSIFLSPKKASTITITTSTPSKLSAEKLGAGIKVKMTTLKPQHLVKNSTIEATGSFHVNSSTIAMPPAIKPTTKTARSLASPYTLSQQSNKTEIKYVPHLFSPTPQVKHTRTLLQTVAEATSSQQKKEGLSPVLLLSSGSSAFETRLATIPIQSRTATSNLLSEPTTTIIASASTFTKETLLSSSQPTTTNMSSGAINDSLKTTSTPPKSTPNTSTSLNSATNTSTPSNSTPNNSTSEDTNIESSGISNIKNTTALSTELYCRDCNVLFKHTMQFNYHKMTYCKGLLEGHIKTSQTVSLNSREPVASSPISYCKKMLEDDIRSPSVLLNSQEPIASPPISQVDVNNNNASDDRNNVISNNGEVVNHLNSDHNYCNENNSNIPKMWSLNQTHTELQNSVNIDFKVTSSPIIGQPMLPIPGYDQLLESSSSTSPKDKKAEQDCIVSKTPVDSPNCETLPQNHDKTKEQVSSPDKIATNTGENRKWIITDGKEECTEAPKMKRRTVETATSQSQQGITRQSRRAVKKSTYCKDLDKSFSEMEAPPEKGNKNTEYYNGKKSRKKTSETQGTSFNGETTNKHNTTPLQHSSLTTRPRRAISKPEYYKDFVLSDKSFEKLQCERSGDKDSAKQNVSHANVEECSQPVSTTTAGGNKETVKNHGKYRKKSNKKYRGMSSSEDINTTELKTSSEPTGYLDASNQQAGARKQINEMSPEIPYTVPDKQPSKIVVEQTPTSVIETIEKFSQSETVVLETPESLLETKHAQKRKRSNSLGRLLDSSFGLVLTTARRGKRDSVQTSNLANNAMSGKSNLKKEKAPSNRRRAFSGSPKNNAESGDDCTVSHKHKEEQVTALKPKRSRLVDKPLDDSSCFETSRVRHGKEYKGYTTNPVAIDTHTSLSCKDYSSSKKRYRQRSPSVDVLADRLLRKQYSTNGCSLQHDEDDEYQQQHQQQEQQVADDRLKVPSLNSELTSTNESQSEANPIRHNIISHEDNQKPEGDHNNNSNNVSQNDDGINDGTIISNNSDNNVLHPIPLPNIPHGLVETVTHSTSCIPRSSSLCFSNSVRKAPCKKRLSDCFEDCQLLDNNVVEDCQLFDGNAVGSFVDTMTALIDTAPSMGEEHEKKNRPKTTLINTSNSNQYHEEIAQLKVQALVSMDVLWESANLNNLNVLL